MHFEVMLPKLNYRHPHHPEHMPDHILSALVGTSASVPFADGRLVLGAWQRLMLLGWTDHARGNWYLR